MSKDPVPEWFGKGEAAPPQHRSAEARSSIGCAVPLVVLLLISGAGAGAFVVIQRANPKVSAKAVAATPEAPQPEPVPAPVPLPPPEAIPAPAPVDPAEAPAEVPSAPVVDGVERLSSAKIQLVIKSSQKRFQACFENALNYAPDAEGTVRLTLTISPAGRVPVVSATQTGSLPPQVASCISAIARTLKFPESPEQTTVTYPFVFKSG